MKATGCFREIDSVEYYEISNIQKMPPFFINITGSSDIWMFLSSNGGLTGGRRDADSAIFPYETDDKIHASTSTGPKTIIRTQLSDGKIVIWEPFDRGYGNHYKIKRNIYKSLNGNAVIFEEINETLKLSFKYKWEISEKYGMVRTSHIGNQGENVKIYIIDGVLNVMPFGISRSMSDSTSCLTDAYKASELEPDGLAIYSLTSKMSDTPEPVEELHANVVWSVGEAAAYLLSTDQISAFCGGTAPTNEIRSAGKKGAYLTYREIEFTQNEEASWKIILDVRKNHHDISVLQKTLNETPVDLLDTQIIYDIKKGTAELIKIVAMGDGLQCTNDKAASAHHFMNVLYNNMRGGIFLDEYSFDYNELLHFVNIRNRNILNNFKEFFEDIRTSGDYSIISLKEKAYQTKNPDIIRLCLEFLPLCFSRRHGDPSRPWNRFSINLKDADGKKIYYYEGNWRDIIQNWESMCRSFPEYLENVIAKFLNASTPDGFNPYRITTDGIDWEKPQPNNPFSGYGYWGDHQIIYLLKLLESLNAHNPEKLERFMNNNIFCYANVPYEIKSYDYLVEDSKNTIIFNYDKDKSITNTVKEYGTDGRLLCDNGKIYYVSFIEKLLIPIMAKISNLIIGGGIWMNTQRPEWNDANNAIVGYGLSMVTVYQLYKHLKFCIDICEKASNLTVNISNEVERFINGVYEVFKRYEHNMKEGGAVAKSVLDETGIKFGEYRKTVYENGFSGKTPVNYVFITEFLRLSLKYIDYTIECSRREDKFYNSYNILTLTKDSLEISPLFPMLEGQTAVIGSGKLNINEAEELTQIMENSGLYSEEQKTFYLYPIKRIKTFIEKNIIPKSSAAASKLIPLLIQNKNDKFVIEDTAGNIRFNENIRQFRDFSRVLNELKNDGLYADLIEIEYRKLCDIYENVFEHRSFTGRSGIMYKYEGIGCIYWHQNSKFLLSYQDCLNELLSQSKSYTKEQKDVYYRIREGLGFNKTPDVWGAFPLDPYSHTPYKQPAQQPGMTGQVKEEILTRYAELGFFVQNGRICFAPALLRRSEFLEKPEKFNYIGVGGVSCEVALDTDSLAYTICQIPVIYKLSKEEKVQVFKTDRTNEIFQGIEPLDKEISKSIFERKSIVNKIIVFVNENSLI